MDTVVYDKIFFFGEFFSLATIKSKRTVQRTIYLNRKSFTLRVEAPFVFLIEDESQKDALPPSRQVFNWLQPELLE